MNIIKSHEVDDRTSKWNDQMYKKTPTPYDGFAGVFEKSRVKKILNLAEIHFNESVLEIGCESGNLLSQIFNAKRIVGLDISELALKDAYEKCNKTPVELFKHDATEPLPFDRGEFDVIICSEVLEHVVDPKKVLNNIQNISTNKTRILVSIPLELINISIKKVLKIFGLMNILFPNIPQGASDWHLHNFSKKMLHNLIDEKFIILDDCYVFVNHYIAYLKKR
jgi:2-polyprenyl-3-methyl-5-hydroxy-6-metoxy-1,4-benzoquinol methylase